MRSRDHEVLSRTIQFQVDQLLLDRGEYEPLEFLLQEGRLSYADYEAWRNGELAFLGQALFGDPDQVGRQLAQAESYLERRGWLAETLRYQAWRSQPADAASAPTRALQFSADRALNERFHRRYRKPQDQPQMDLFTDAPATNLVNGIVQSLGDRDPPQARQLLERLFKIAPDHNRLGELERLTEAAETLNSPVTDVMAELRRLQETLIPLADGLLGTASHNLLIPLWRRLSRALQNRRFDATAPELHLSYAAAQALDWAVVRQAVEREPDWQSVPVLLVRHARACERLHEFAAALLTWFNLCWRFPQHADSLDSSTNHELRQHWTDFQDLDPGASVESFPAWLLVRKPGLTQILPEPATVPAVCPESYRTVYTLQHDHAQSAPMAGADSVALRARLKQQDPILFEQFLNAITT